MPASPVSSVTWPWRRPPPRRSSTPSQPERRRLVDGWMGENEGSQRRFLGGTGVRGGTSPGRRSEARDISSGATRNFRRRAARTRGKEVQKAQLVFDRRSVEDLRVEGRRQTVSNVGMRGGPARESSVDAPAAPPPGTTARDAPRAHRRVPRPAATDATARTEALAAPWRVSVGTGRRRNIVVVTRSHDGRCDVASLFRLSSHPRRAPRAHRSPPRSTHLTLRCSRQTSRAPSPLRDGRG